MAPVAAAGLLFLSSCSLNQTEGEEGSGRPSDADVTLTAVQFRAEVDATSGTASVRTSHDMRISSGTGTIEFRAVSFGDRKLQRLRAHLGVDTLSITSAATGSGKDRLAAVIVSRVQLSDSVPDRNSVRIDVAYEVEGALRRREGNVDVQIPVLLANGSVEQSRGDFFEALVRLPRDLEIRERFPTVAWEKEVVRSATNYRFRLPSAPSLVRFRGSIGAGSWFTLAKALDIAVILFLLGLLPLGWWITRRT